MKFDKEKLISQECFCNRCFSVHPIPDAKRDFTLRDLTIMCSRIISHPDGTPTWHTQAIASSLFAIAKSIEKLAENFKDKK